VIVEGNGVTDDKVVSAVLPASDRVQAIDYLQVDPVPRAVRDARRFVRSHAPKLPPETTETLLLLASELVTNAVLHARTPISVGVVVAEQSVVVTVHDLDLALPSQDPYANREGGWGLKIVQSLAHSWAMSSHAEGGKTAWFRLLRQPPPRVPDAAAARDNGEGRD
jgi:two-component sensor histidine kinase